MENSDLRIQKTKISLFQAFACLIQRKKFEDISINELCDEAQVRRATFYNHYSDKYAFFSDAVKRIFALFTEDLNEGSESMDSIERYKAIVRRLLDFLDSNQKMLESVLRSRISDLLYTIIVGEMEKFIMENLRKDFGDGNMSDTERSILTQVFTGSLANICRWWLYNKDKITKEDLLEYTIGLLKQVLQPRER